MIIHYHTVSVMRVYDYTKIQSPREFVCRLVVWDLCISIRKFRYVGARKELFSGKRTYYIIIYYIPIYIHTHGTRPTRPVADVVPHVCIYKYSHTFANTKLQYKLIHVYIHIMCIIHAFVLYIYVCMYIYI